MLGTPFRKVRPRIAKPPAKARDLFQSRDRQERTGNNVGTFMKWMT
jgi:hypothetical protein